MKSKTRGTSKKRPKRVTQILKAKLPKKIKASLLALEKLRPIISTFLDALISPRMPGSVRVRRNPDLTIDGEAKISVPRDMDPQTALHAVEAIYHLVLPRFPQIHDCWLKLAAIFRRSKNVWRSYRLPGEILSDGREMLAANIARAASDSGDVWAALFSIVDSVLKAYQSPSVLGELRPEYRLTHILVRLHCGDDPPLY